MKVAGENVCPRCQQGVLQKRTGKNGIFWGCSNYPKCRMTCNDKDGRPDMEDARSRLARSPRGRMTADSGAYQSYPASAAGYTAQDDSEPSAQDMEDFKALFSPADYEAGLAADMQAYRDSSPWKEWKRWTDKSRYSASPLEHMTANETAGGKHAAPREEYLCPRCREGKLHQIRGKNGTFWGCTNYPRCTATFDDEKNKPVL